MELEQLYQALENADRLAQQGDQQALDDARVIAQMIQEQEARRGVDIMPPAPAPSVAEDVARSAAGGGIFGATAALDMPSQIGGLMRRGAQGAAEMLGVDPNYARVFGEAMGSFGPFAERPPSLETVSEFAPSLAEMEAYQPQTRAGRFARTTAEMAPGFLMTPGGPVARGVYGVLAPGIASEAAGQLAEEFGAEQGVETAARIGGAILGPSLLSIGQRAITPRPGIDPARTARVEALRGVGVEDITAGQAIGDEAIMALEDRVTASPSQLRQFRDALIRSFGGTPQDDIGKVLSAEDARFNDAYRSIAQGVDLTPSQGLAQRFASIANTYRQIAPTEARAPLVDNIADALQNAAQTGRPISADTMMTWRSNLSRLTRSPRPDLRQTYIEAVEAVDDLIADSLTAAGRPEDISRYAQIRGQYRDFKAFEQAATGGGIAPLEGNVTPESVANALRSQNRGQYARGQRGDFGEIARAGEQILRAAPTVSAGSQRIIPGMESAQMAETMATIGSASGPGAAAGLGLIGRLVNPARRAFVQDPLGQMYLQNQLLGAPSYAPFSGRVAGYSPLAMLGANRD